MDSEEGCRLLATDGLEEEKEAMQVGTVVFPHWPRQGELAKSQRHIYIDQLIQDCGYYGR